MSNKFSGGFLRDLTRSLVVSSLVEGAKMRNGFLRGPEGELIVTPDLPSSVVSSSGATKGNVPIADGEDGYAWGAGGGGGGLTEAEVQALIAENRLYFNPMKYGALGDGTTDDSAAWEEAYGLAINELFSGIPATLYAPSGKYYLATGLDAVATANGAIPNIVGEGQPGLSSGLAKGSTQILVGDGEWGITFNAGGEPLYRGILMTNLEFYEMNSGKALGGYRLLRLGNSVIENVAAGEFKMAVASTFNGTPGALSTLETLTLASTTGWSASGSGHILTAQGWAGFFYTGVAGSTLTGCVYTGLSTETVASEAPIVADVGVGAMIDGRVPGTGGGDAPYNNLIGCKFGKCGAAGYLQYAANGTSMNMATADGNNNSNATITLGTIGLLIGSGDTFKLTGGSRLQGFDTLAALRGNHGHVLESSTRYEIWRTNAVHVYGDAGGNKRSVIGGGGNNSLYGSEKGTGITIDAGVTNLINLAEFVACATPVTDNGTGTRSPYTETAGALTNKSNYLSADVTMTTKNLYYDGPSLKLAAGTYLLTGVVEIQAGSSAIRTFTAKLWDGTTAVSTGGQIVPGTATPGMASIPVSGIVTLTEEKTYKISASSTVDGETLKGTGVPCSYLHAVKIA